VDCVRWASCIQEPKSRKNQVEWYRSLDLITGRENNGQVGNFRDDVV